MGRDVCLHGRSPDAWQQRFILNNGRAKHCRVMRFFPWVRPCFNGPGPCGRGNAKRALHGCGIQGTGRPLGGDLRGRRSHQPILFRRQPRDVAGQAGAWSHGALSLQSDPDWLGRPRRPRRLIRAIVRHGPLLEVFSPGDQALGSANVLEQFQRRQGIQVRLG